MKNILALAAALSLLAIPTASAQQTGWRHEAITGGCTMVVQGAMPPGVTSRWDQTCTAGQPISGAGALSVNFPTTGRTVVMQATFVSGVPHGLATMTAYDASGTALQSAQMTFNMGCEITSPQPCDPYQP